MSTNRAPIRSDWSEQQVRQLLQREDFDYQRIELPYGLATGGRDRADTCAKILPDDMSGLSLLDVGCFHGYFCFEALRRGAERTLGVDVDPQRIRQARLLADCLGYADRAEFRVLDVDREPLDQSFDYVLCLNVLHHVRNPIGVIEKLFDHTKRQLVMELAGMSRRDIRPLGLNWLDSLVLRRLPVMIVGDSGTASRHHGRTYLITPAAVRNMLTMHRNTCARVDQMASEFKDRQIVIAHKRRIRHLLVVAGLVAGGKSTLIGQLQRSENEPVAEAIGRPDIRDWPVIEAGRMHRMTQPQLDGLTLEYNLMYVHQGGAKTHDRDEVMGVIDTADKVTVITVWTPPDELRRQLDQRDREVAGKKNEQELREFHEKVRRKYSDDARVLEIYRMWLDYACKRFDQHIVVSPAQPPLLRSPDDLRAQLETQAAEIAGRTG